MQSPYMLTVDKDPSDFSRRNSVCSADLMLVSMKLGSMHSRHLGERYHSLTSKLKLNEDKNRGGASLRPLLYHRSPLATPSDMLPYRSCCVMGSIREYIIRSRSG